MKKLFSLVFAVLALVSLCSCGDSSDTRAASVTFDTLPGEIPCSESTVALSDVKFCEVYTNHGYTGYCIVIVDRRNMSDDDVYWLLKQESYSSDRELEANVYLSSEANSLESESMSKLKTTYDDNNIYFMFYTRNEMRNSLSDFHVSVQLIEMPDKKLTADSTAYYYYNKKADDGVDYSDYESILAEKELKLLEAAIQEYADEIGEEPG